ncbi:hypothetical protein LXL04_016587 [Taraxacum kok-saghyz]
MCALRIHTHDTSQPSFATQFGGGAATSGTKFVVAGGSNPKSKKNLSSPTDRPGPTPVRDGLRNDAMEDQYSVLIDGFCCSYNGKRFSPSETEVFHIYFSQLVEYTDSTEITSIPQLGYTEFLTCPVCLGMKRDM